MIVLDASALLALLFQEPGHEVVAEHLGKGCISTVNLAEVLARYQREGRDSQTLYSRLCETGLELVPFDADTAALSVSLSSRLQPWGLSLGDRVCIALGIARQLPVLTADRVWTQIPLDIEVQLIR